MGEYRYNVATSAWVVVATDRQRRPGAMPGRVTPDLPPYSRDCPFCPGNEAMTTETILLVPPDASPSGWRMRCFPNKFPVVTPDAPHEGEADALPAVGSHEVIVETPAHDEEIRQRPIEVYEDLAEVYHQRLQAIAAMPRMNYFLLSRNHGRESGASLDHPHSQVMATSIVPTAIETRWRIAAEVLSSTGRCLYCGLAANESRDSSRVVWQDDEFVAFLPFAAAYPGETWLLPRAHSQSYLATTPSQRQRFAAGLRACLLALADVFDKPDFNYVIHTAPRGLEAAPYCHWHLQLMPRIARLGGLELGTGLFVNSFPPETTAPLLRQALLDRGLQ